MTIALPRSDAPRVSILIATFTRPDLLHACLRSLERFAPAALPFETIVVLNESSAEAETRLRDTVDGVLIEWSPINLGFAGAMNRGRLRARGEFIVLLHDDAEINPRWLEVLVETADMHPEAGAIGSQAIFPDGTVQNGGGIIWRNGGASPPWVGEAPPPSHFTKLRAVDYTGSSSLLVRASVWDRIGGLDERYYPIYFADADLCMAVRQAGYVVLYQPASRIIHHRGASTNHRFAWFVSARNHKQFAEKWAEALQQHLPPAGETAAGIELAIANAQAMAERIRGSRPALVEAQPLTFDPAVQERRLLEKSNELQKAYVAHLGSALDAAEAAAGNAAAAVTQAEIALKQAQGDAAAALAKVNQALKEAQDNALAAQGRAEIARKQADEQIDALRSRVAAQDRMLSSRSTLLRLLLKILIFGKRDARR
jgi:GT2 family glycosyltransferase